MGKVIRVRDVPETVYRTLKRRAARNGLSLSAYVRGELALIAARPTPDEIRVRLRQRSSVAVGPARERPAAILRRIRDSGR